MSALNDKVVIVTGGSFGIGRAAALGFARKGARVLITARRAVPLEEAAAGHPILPAWSRMRPRLTMPCVPLRRRSTPGANWMCW